MSVPRPLLRSPPVVLASFLAALTVVVLASVFAVVKAVGLWRQAKRTGRAFGDELAKFEARTARTEELLAEAERAHSQLEPALTRLRASRARLRVLVDETENAKRRLRWIAAFLPI
jgi:septal ring factor EnvC (AmiA/AmiB activator)